MQTIKAFKTDDGQIFESKQDAEAHERHAKFAAWYNEDNEDLEGACIKQVKLIKAQWK